MIRIPHPFTAHERDGIIAAIETTFGQLDGIHDEISDLFVRRGLALPTANVLTSERSIQVAHALVRDTSSFHWRRGGSQIERCGEIWDVVAMRGSGLAINQIRIATGENFMGVNFDEMGLRRVFAVWRPDDGHFSPPSARAQIRNLRQRAAADHIEDLYRIDARGRRVA
jgi:hypothetical protein